MIFEHYKQYSTYLPGLRKDYLEEFIYLTQLFKVKTDSTEVLSVFTDKY
jgi:hypothetical protein